MYRIGNGYDVHAFTEGDQITLGGVKIPHNKAFLAHSDGDVLIHALCDAMLGALSLGDIGEHFPDTDDEFSNIDSRKLLRHVVSLVKAKGYSLQNCDNTIVAQAPKMSPYILTMRRHLAEDLQVNEDAIGVKATTTEKLGFAGRGEGIAVYSVVLLKKILD
jgi:2-C-methyl-D-erythritol 2,4-cyclodiphosphate synthase